MKIAILSDTHDNTPAIVWAIEYMNQNNISVALHAGDIINPGILHRFRDHYTGHLHFVFGNNDGEQALLERRANHAENITCHLHEMRETFEEISIFMNHYSSISETIAKSGDFDVSIGGHDHEFRISKYKNTLFINPGNMVTKDKWLPQEPDKESSFVVLETETLTADRIMLSKDFQH